MATDTMTVWLEPKGWANPNRVPVQAEWHCGHSENGHECCTPMEPHRHDWSCGWLVKP